MDDIGIDNQLVFTLLSIKTRIETIAVLCLRQALLQFLLYYPLKQGLKHKMGTGISTYRRSFYSTIH